LLPESLKNKLMSSWNPRNPHQDPSPAYIEAVQLVRMWIVNESANASLHRAMNAQPSGFAYRPDRPKKSKPSKQFGRRAAFSM
jgi:hypothetical protein